MLIRGQGATAADLQIDASHRAARWGQFPDEYAYRGSYTASKASATMAAGLFSSSPIFVLQWRDPVTICKLEHVSIQAFQLAAPAANALWRVSIQKFDLLSTVDTGGTTWAPAIGIPNTSKRRTSLPYAHWIFGGITNNTLIQISTTASLTSGAKNAYSTFGGIVFGAFSTVANTPMISPKASDLYVSTPGEHPMIFGENEGFEIWTLDTGPALATFQITVNIDWSEYEAYGYK